MPLRLYPPVIENTLPAFYGTSLEVPFEMNGTVGKDSIEGFILQLRSLTSNATIINNLTTNNYDIEKGLAYFHLLESQTNKLNQGQYYKLQMAYLPQGYTNNNLSLSMHTNALEKLKTIEYVNPSIGVSELKTQFFKMLTEFYNLYRGNDEQLLIQSGDIQSNWDKYWSESIEYSNHQALLTQLANTAFEIPEEDDQRIKDLLDQYDQESDTPIGFDNNSKLYYNALLSALESMQNNYIKSDAIQNDIILKYYQQAVNVGTYNLTDIEAVTRSSNIQMANINFINKYSKICEIMSKSDAVKFNEVKKKIVALAEAAAKSGYTSVRVDDTYPVVGYYSITAVIKYTGTPKIGIQDLETYRTSSRTSEFIGYYENSDITERVKRYGFVIRDSQGKMIEQISEKIHNNDADTKTTLTGIISTDTYSPNALLENGKIYNIQYAIETISGLKIESPKYNIACNTYIDIGSNDAKFTMYFDLDNGCIKLAFESHDAIFGQGTFVLSRLYIKDGKTIKEKMQQVHLLNDLTNTIPYFDYTIEHGIKYQYILERINKTGICSKPIYALTENGKDSITANFEDSFLTDGDRQLRIRFNPKISSFKQDILETKTDTIGSQYPFIFRNGSVSYKEFPISGLISRIQNDKFGATSDIVDSTLKRDETPSLAIAQIPNYNATDLVDENIKAEREFKLAVLNWLTNGKPKLFRSPTEGNYLVRLMNTQLSPEDRLGRMLHTFSCTAYEIAECNYNNLLNCGILKADNNIVETTFGSSSYYFTREKDAGNTNLFGDLGLGIQSVLVEAPGSPINSYILIDGKPVNIGATGKYELPQGVMCGTVGLPSGEDAPLAGVITVTYKMYKTTIFDQIKDVGITQYPVSTVIGREPVAGETVFDPLLNPGSDQSIHIKESISSIKFLRFNLRPLEFVQHSNGNYLRQETLSDGTEVLAPNMEQCVFPYISRLPLYYITPDNTVKLEHYNFASGRPITVMDLSYYYKKNNQPFEFYINNNITSLDYFKNNFTQVVIKYKTNSQGQKIISKFNINDEKIIEINGNQEIEEIQLGQGVYMEIGYDKAENIFLIEETTADESLQQAKITLNEAKNNLLTFRDQAYNSNFVDANGFTQKYMNWFIQRIILERQYNFAKTQYELVLKQLIEQK